jgi:peptidoglycan-associated lipoprotein
MAAMMRYLTAAAALAGLSACGNQDPTRTPFFGEAGAAYDDGGFGNATMNNVLLQSGAADYRINLARRFEAEVQSTITFEFNSYALDDASRAVLRQQADWINQFPEVRFKVFGHTDLVGSTAYNRQLGLRRAEAVVLYLASLGVDRSRLEAVVSFGEDQPLIVTEGRERRNRRTVTEVSGFVESHPSVLNGKYAEVIFREYVASAVPAVEITVADAAGVGSGE